MFSRSIRDEVQLVREFAGPNGFRRWRQAYRQLRSGPTIDPAALEAYLGFARSAPAFAACKDFDSVPVTTRADFGSRFSDYIVTQDGQLPFSRYTLMRSSGSTTAPVTTVWSEQDMCLEFGLALRQFHSLQIPLTGVIYAMGPGDDRSPLVRYQATYGAYVVVAAERLFADPSALCTMLRNRPPIALMGAPSRLARFASICSELGVVVEPRAIVTAFEPLGAGIRAKLRAVFDCTVCSTYSSTELGMCAWECRCDRLHFIDDWLHVEVLDNADAPIRKDGVGRLVITSIKSSIMPRLRYDTGDLSAAVSIDCKCGLRGPSISRIAGRQSDAIALSDESLVPFAALESLLDTFRIEQWQVLQSIPGHARFIFTVMDRDIDEGSLRAAILRTFAGLLTVDIEIGGPFVTTGRGKVNRLVHTWK